MDRRNIRYEVLSGEDERVPAEPVVLAMVVPLAGDQHLAPPLARWNRILKAFANSLDPDETPQNLASHQDPNYEIPSTKLPSYQEATTLPSYEEAERSKAAEALLGREGERQRDLEASNLSEVAVGTDGMFLCTFILSFLFNWIGFLFSVCLVQTIAGRCGALSGLGLGIVKWVLIIKHNQWAAGYADQDSWVWWLLIFCGFMIFIRGAVEYARFKFEWNRVRIQVRSYRLF